ncbi:hypothetical protein K1719_029715 [Acacia pycnantha]|nr:hypothetical protein K1719_029715 [Acacia pycnantha]
MCVELDLTKPLIPSFIVEVQKLSVVYESLSLLCIMCGWYRHSKEGCKQFHKSHNEEKMDVEVQGEKDRKGDENGEVKELWKMVQRSRRPRRFDMPNQEEHTGSRFAVLSENAGEEVKDREVTHTKEKGEDSIGVVKGLKEKVQHQHLKQGKQNVMKSDSFAACSIRKSHVGKPGQMEKLGQAPRRDKVLVVRNSEGVKSRAVENIQVSKSCEIVPESIMETNKWKMVNSNGKENLHPGGFLWGLDLILAVHDLRAKKRSQLQVWRQLWGKSSLPLLWLSVDNLFRYKADVAIILEPRISGMLATKTIKNWGFKFSVRVEVVGFSGGIWILWNLEDLCVDVLMKEEQFIHCRLRLNGKGMLLTAVYANPREQRRQRVWDSLHKLAIEITEPWLLAGDFNEIKSPLEQKGGGRVNETRCRKFSDWIQNCGFLDIEPKGPFFTWKGPKWEGLERVYKRLDRCLCNAKFVTA